METIKMGANTDRYHDLFVIRETLTLQAGKEWLTLEPSEIVELILQIAEETIREARNKRRIEICLFREKKCLLRWWAIMRGWKIPKIPSRVEILRNETWRCRRLMRTMMASCNQVAFIDKPSIVAIQLEEIMDNMTT